jgi:Flp pilus assembly protein TadD
LRQSLALAPENPSLRLKWAQLDYLAGDAIAAKRLLLELREQPFPPGERETLTNLLNRLAADGN